jgi:hypothetical protein
MPAPSNASAVDLRALDRLFDLGRLADRHDSDVNVMLDRFLSGDGSVSRQ